MARDKDFDLRGALARPNFTPGQRDIAALVELIATDEDAAVRASPALAKLGDAARAAIVGGIGGAAIIDDARGGASVGAGRADRTFDEGGAARLVVALGLMARAGDREARVELITRIGDARVRVRRAAIVALGKLGATRATRADDRDGARRDHANDARARPDHANDARETERLVEQREGARRDHANDARETKRLVELREGARRDAERRAEENEPLVDLREGERRGDDRRASEPDDDVRAALIARWDASDVPPDERRALAEALGKIGGAGVRERLESLDAASDKELARRRDRALLVADREDKRGEDSEVITDKVPPRPLVVRLSCRPALAELLISEARAAGFDGKAVRDDAVDVPLDRPWSALFASRLWASAAIRIEDRGLREARGDRAKATEAIVRAVVSDEIRGLMTAWTRGPIRWRLSLARGHQRAVVWTVAKEVTKRAPMLINDPTQTTWDVRVDDEEGVLELVPRRAEDPRYAYRVAEVPAASHPSIAAAVVWLAAIREGERVWDPFCGSGLELAEAALRGAGTLVGSDLDDGALDAARANLEAAGIASAINGAAANEGRHAYTGAANEGRDAYAGGANEGRHAYAGAANEGRDAYAGGTNEGRHAYAGGTNEGRHAYAGGANEGRHAYAGGTNEGGHAYAGGADAGRASDEGRPTDAGRASDARRPNDGGRVSDARRASAATAELVRGDARRFAPSAPVDAIITNPPLGSRVHVDAGALLAEALPHFVRQLTLGGRLVWITPRWRRTTPVAEANGLVLVRSLFVDLGGVRGRLERWDRQR